MRFTDFSPLQRAVPELGVGAYLWGIPCLEDNLAWGLSHPDGSFLLIDAPEADPIRRFLDEHSYCLDRILITHGHRDHTAGLEGLSRGGTVEILANPRLGIPHARPLPGNGEPLTWKGLEIRIFDTSGHSDCDVSFYLPALGLCFCGDTLFAGGCGRLFAGPPERMWQSLLRLRNLPDDTLLCFGHEYALENYRFARQTFPEIPEVSEPLARVLSDHEAGRIYAPVSVGEQSRTNPMLMADHPAIAIALGMSGQPPEDIFGEIRSRRSAF